MPTLETIQLKYDRLLKTVRKMRHYQAAYKVYRISSDRINARNYEREVDRLITQELKGQKSKQQEIF
jgi:hypothetical protein